MSRPTVSTTCQRCRAHLSKVQRSLFSSSSRKQADPPARGKFTTYTPEGTGTRPSTKLDELARVAESEARHRPRAGVGPDEPYHLNLYTHKHNTHITFTHPSRDPILSFSSGNIGLKKAQRGTYDAGYQLASYTFRKITEINWRIGGKKAGTTPITLNDPDVRRRGIELIFRGYGNGREAFQKALLGQEGRMIKPIVKKVTDATRSKFGGARSPHVRRLG